jgi:hypothetical protein
MAMLPAFKVPVPTASVVVEAYVGAFMIIAPPTVSVFVPEILIPPLDVGALKVMLAHTAVGLFTIRVAPVSMIMVSVLDGCPPAPDPVVMAVQFSLL